MVKYDKKSYELLARSESFEIIQVLREENGHVKALANLGLA